MTRRRDVSRHICGCLHWTQRDAVTGTSSEQLQRERIAQVFGAVDNRPPNVDEKTLRHYYRYLVKNLTLPFAACYPQPTSAAEAELHRCSVLELLDPARHLGDEFDGIYCKTRKGWFEVNLPLIELHLPEDSPISSWSRTTGTGSGIGALNPARNRGGGGEPSLFSRNRVPKKGPSQAFWSAKGFKERDFP